MAKELKNETKSRFTEKQLQSTPKEILQILLDYVNEEIKHEYHGLNFVEVTLSRKRNTLIPQMQAELGVMIRNNENKTKIKKKQKELSEYIESCDSDINSYKNYKKCIKCLEKDALMISKFL